MQKFSEMFEIERKQWLAWARSHDWGRSAFWDSLGELAGVEEWIKGLDGEWELLHPTFETPGELKAWAGY